jgi:hypothetical protein
VTPETGVFVQPESDLISTAIRRISKNPARYHDACIVRANAFDIVQFSEILKKAVREIPRENFIKSRVRKL